MNHSFNIDIATQYGIEEAILIENFAHWIRVNAAKKSNYKEGYYWMWNTTTSLSEIFPHMSRSTINRKVNKLVELGVLKSGAYNKRGYDRTLWYTFVYFFY